jgi:hypothetical protein
MPTRCENLRSIDIEDTPLSRVKRNVNYPSAPGRIETNNPSPPLSYGESFCENRCPRGQTELSALLDANSRPKTTEQWETIADRRSSPIVVRLCAGLFSLYRRATGARESDPFLRDAKSWAAFEQASHTRDGLLHLLRLRARDTTLTPNAVLADAMYYIWTSLRPCRTRRGCNQLP